MGEGCYWETPVFSNIKKAFGTYLPSSFPDMWKFRTQVTQCQATRSRQVTSSQKSLNARNSYTDWPIALKLSAMSDLYEKQYIHITQCISRKFYIGGPRSGQFCDLFYGIKFKGASFGRKTFLYCIVLYCIVLYLDLRGIPIQNAWRLLLRIRIRGC